jgi:hypothetical protein
VPTKWVVEKYFSTIKDLSTHIYKEDNIVENSNVDVDDNENTLFKKAKDNAKNKTANKEETKQSAGGNTGGKMPEDPDEERKQFKLVGDKEAKEVGRTEQFGKIYKDSLNQKWGNKEIKS